MEEKRLYKSHGVLWMPVIAPNGVAFIGDNPLCPNQNCHNILDKELNSYLCVKCDKKYECKKDHRQIRKDVEKAWHGYLTLDYTIHSLDLPPTKVIDEAEDDNYWVQARLGEKNGKRMAVIYFGEKIKGKQTKDDYSQIFLDFEDEQFRFDKNNKNPMNLLAKLTVEFPSSLLKVERKTDVK